jgi:hypothetical protein
MTSTTTIAILAGTEGPLPALTPDMLARADEVFEDWLCENSDVIRENGGTGDTQSLFAALWASWKNDL